MMPSATESPRTTRKNRSRVMPHHRRLLLSLAWDSDRLAWSADRRRHGRTHCAGIAAMLPIGSPASARYPVAGWQSDPCSTSYVVVIQLLVSMEAACQPTLPVGRLAGWVAC